MDAEREALWNEIDLEPRESAPAVDSDVNAGNDTSLTLMNAEIRLPQSSEYIMDDEKDFHGFTKFHRLCALPRKGPLDPRWGDVRRYLSNLSQDDAESELTSTQKEGFSYTPLHVACFICPPHDVVEQLIQLCPKSARIVTNHGDYPVSLACGGFVPAGGEVIQELIKAYPEARDETNSRDENPLLIHLKTMRNYELDPCPFVVKLLATVEAVNTRDLKGHSPLYYLGRAATEAFSFQALCVRFFSVEGESDPDFVSFKNCLSVIVSLYPDRDSKTLFLRDLLQLPANLRDVSFEHKSTRVVINSIVGRGQYIALLMMDFYFQLSIVVAFTLGCADSFKNKSYTTVTLVGSAYWLLKRLVSAIGSSEKWTKIKVFHLITVVQAIVLMASSIYLRNNGLNLGEEGESGPWRNILIINSLLIWVTMIGIGCHTLKGFSVFVHATVQIFKKLFNLFLVFAVIFVCFSTMFFVSAVDSSTYCDVDEESGDYSGDYCTLQDSMEKVYTLFFGTLEADDFDVPDPTLVTLFFFNIIVIILLLNIIIAVMSDCYADVNSDAELVFWDHRFELIQDVDAVTNFITQLFNSCCKNCSKKTKITKGETQDVGAMNHEWFGKIIHFKKSTRIPKPIMNLFTFVVMGLWFLVGLCTFGITWPRHTRRKLFSPSVSDHLTEGESKLEVEFDIMKKENRFLDERNSRLTKENKAIRKMLDALQNKSP
mmetsp:Transcript_38896/g.71270  ORF Transcript_38896/g.71270 Transcript_38896/m.71270 type:complete len:713 (+) Transcript_38896:152-2290(+)|eukprot:CAMPEP_0201874582 /NCGR_PEP_ID=MMETSP0902-20130614/6795_1 /ASSEMBLY_ACC=CAM_ASM_000551 /TAXON_ID=420261 /ORGANISM="Thalassiosira antarctica, Strain CCMP982" /LENGTH=712 /DNA_ID=CAMNT_0048401481 /DNA_START=108 /DNA_END=2246 /DNA_ORIENTATION=+